MKLLSITSCLLTEANILNITVPYEGVELDAYVKTNTVDAPERERAALHKKLVKLLVNDGRVHRKLSELPANAPAWASQAFSSGQEMFVFVPPSNLSDQIQHISHYVGALVQDQASADGNIKAVATREIQGIGRAENIDLIIQKSNQYFARGSKKASNSVDGTEHVVDAGSGYNWYLLVTDEAYAREGKMLQNCIGTNYTTANSDKIYVMKTPSGESVVAVRVSPSNEVQECKGKNNKPPIDKYMPYVGKLFPVIRGVLDRTGAFDFMRAGYTILNNTLVTLDQALNHLKDTAKLIERTANFDLVKILVSSTDSHAAASVFRDRSTEGNVDRYLITASGGDSVVLLVSKNKLAMASTLSETGSSRHLIPLMKDGVQSLVDNGIITQIRSDAGGSFELRDLRIVDGTIVSTTQARAVALSRGKVIHQFSGATLKEIPSTAANDEVELFSAAGTGVVYLASHPMKGEVIAVVDNSALTALYPTTSSGGDHPKKPHASKDQEHELALEMVSNMVSIGLITKLLRSRHDTTAYDLSAYKIEDGKLLKKHIITPDQMKAGSFSADDIKRVAKDWQSESPHAWNSVLNAKDIITVKGVDEQVDGFSPVLMVGDDQSSLIEFLTYSYFGNGVTVMTMEVYSSSRKLPTAVNKDLVQQANNNSVFLPIDYQLDNSILGGRPGSYRLETKADRTTEVLSKTLTKSTFNTTTPSDCVVLLSQPVTGSRQLPAITRSIRNAVGNDSGVSPSFESTATDWIKNTLGGVIPNVVYRVIAAPGLQVNKVNPIYLTCKDNNVLLIEAGKHYVKLRPTSAELIQLIESLNDVITSNQLSVSSNTVHNVSNMTIQDGLVAVKASDKRLIQKNKAKKSKVAEDNCSFIDYLMVTE